MATPEPDHAATAEPQGESEVSDWIREGRPPARLRRRLLAGQGRREVDRDGDTPMHLAAASPDPRYLALLLEVGFDPNTANTLTGRLPIVTAMIWERRAQVRALLAAGVDLARTDGVGNSPLHVAAQINDPAFALLLLEHGAPPQARNHQGQTFQVYLFMTPDRLLSASAREDREAVARWLDSRNIALDQRPGW